jgi:hypothetical protein
MLPGFELRPLCRLARIQPLYILRCPGSISVDKLKINAILLGVRGSLVVKALGYKPEGRGFETQWDNILNLPNPSGRTRQWVTQPLTKMSTGNIKKKMFLGSKVRPVRGADNLTAIYELTV